MNTSKAYDEILRDALAEFNTEWNKYAESGICDTEGRWACQTAIIKKMEGIPWRVSFSRLQGYTCYTKSETCPYTKREIGNNMARALTKLSKAFRKAYKKYGYTTTRWGRDHVDFEDFMDAIW